MSNGQVEELHEPWVRSPQWATLPEALRDAATEAPDLVAVIDGQHRLTYADLEQRSRVVARALVAAGFQPGDRAGLWLGNRWEWPVLCLGAWRAGGTIVPINTRLKGLEAADMLRRTRPTVLFAASTHLGNDFLLMLRECVGGPVAGRPFADLPNLHTVVAVDDGPGREACVDLQAFLAGGASVDESVVAEREAGVGPDTDAEILFTSGTTGVPKGVVLAHQQLLRTYWDWSGIVGLGPDDRFLLTSPYSHGPGINGHLVTSLMRRFASVLIDVFDPEEALRLMLDEGVSAMLGPANLYARLLATDHGTDHPRLRLALLGMASVPGELTARLREEWGVELLCNAYGLIEGSVVSMTRPDDPPAVVEGTSGRPLPDVEVRLAAADGSDVPVGERGEILVRSFAVMRRYWEAPEATLSALDADGWLHTGDIGELDEVGNLAIVGRTKDVFTVNGFNVYPAEVENLLLHHGGIEQAAVVPVADAGTGEAGIAFVVPSPGCEIDADEVVAWARRSMANYKVPRQVVVLGELPVGTTGKVDRAGLQRSWLAAHPTGSAG